MPYSRLSDSEKLELTNTFKEQINLDRDLEKAKIDLALRSDFNLDDAFKIFDAVGRGYITAYELEDGLRALGVNFLRDETNLLIRHFNQ
mmetsp:Transcript_21114/g.3427  ORF Transcript_21114/g.3427 Transcript_21114/m.3427 type:complete len:89 (+) Transcript_21114:1316-1582(+)